MSMWHPSDFPRTLTGCEDQMASYRRMGREPPQELVDHYIRLGGQIHEARDTHADPSIVD